MADRQIDTGRNDRLRGRAVAVSIDTTFLRRCIASLERAVEGTPWFASNRQADRLQFKDLFRHAARHDLIPTGAVERWLRYLDNRSFTAHASRFGLNTWFVIAVCVVALLLINRHERRNDASMTRATIGIAAQDESSGR